jgi:hypothetical protein
MVVIEDYYFFFLQGQAVIIGTVSPLRGARTERTHPVEIILIMNRPMLLRVLSREKFPE